MTNQTENEQKGEEAQTPKYRHLAPSVHAQDLAKPGEETVDAFVPHKFILTLSDGTRQTVLFTAGNYPIPARLRNHFYLAANGVTFGKAASAPPRQQLEGGADLKAAGAAAEAEAAAAAEAKAKEEAVNAAKAKLKSATADDMAALDDLGFDALGGITNDLGLDTKALGSKDARRKAIRDLKAELDAA